MTKKTIIALSIAAVVLLFGLITIGSIISAVNGYSRLEVKAKAKETDNRNVLDNTRKKVREAGAVSQQEVDALVKIVTGYADARGKNTAGNGALVTVGSVHEAVPGITDIKTLRNLQNIVVASRQDWQNAQTGLIEVKRQADEKLAVWPSSMILSMLGKQPIEIKVIASEETEGNFASGKDDSSWVK